MELDRKKAVLHFPALITLKLPQVFPGNKPQPNNIYTFTRKRRMLDL